MRGIGYTNNWVSSRVVRIKRNRRRCSPFPPSPPECRGTVPRRSLARRSLRWEHLHHDGARPREAMAVGCRRQGGRRPRDLRGASPLCGGHGGRHRARTAAGSCRIRQRSSTSALRARHRSLYRRAPPSKVTSRCSPFQSRSCAPAGSTNVASGSASARATLVVAPQGSPTRLSSVALGQA